MEQTERNLMEQVAQLDSRKEFLAWEQRCIDFIKLLEEQSSIKRPQLLIDVRESLIARIARLESLKGHLHIVSCTQNTVCKRGHTMHSHVVNHMYLHR